MYSTDRLTKLYSVHSVHYRLTPRQDTYSAPRQFHYECGIEILCEVIHWSEKGFFENECSDPAGAVQFEALPTDQWSDQAAQ